MFAAEIGAKAIVWNPTPSTLCLCFGALCGRGFVDLFAFLSGLSCFRFLRCSLVFLCCFVLFIFLGDFITRTGRLGGFLFLVCCCCFVFLRGLCCLVLLRLRSLLFLAALVSPRPARTSAQPSRTLEPNLLRQRLRDLSFSSGPPIKPVFAVTMRTNVEKRLYVHPVAPRACSRTLTGLYGMLRPLVYAGWVVAETLIHG
jgi:hypothetical protein